MKKIRLKVGLSYTIMGFSCKAGSPFDIDDEKAAELLATGRFEEVSMAVCDVFVNDDAPVNDDDAPVNDDMPVNNDDATAKSGGSEGSALSADSVSAMTKAELAELAKAKDIDISGCKNKADIVDRINGALGLVSMVQMGLET